MDSQVLALSKAFTKASIKGLGSIQGAPCTISNVTTDSSGNTVVTFQWTATDGSTKTQTATINKGDKGDKGEKGEQGEAGVAGAQGVRGLTGPEGPQGIKGDQGEQGVQGIQGIQGVQGVQGIQGEKGDDGYPFLIYKQYDSLDDYNAADFPEIGLMFMVMTWEKDSEGNDKGYPIYRFIGNDSDPSYSLITHMNTTGIKGDKGDKGDQGEQGVAGENGKTYIPTIGTVETLEYGNNATASVNIEGDAVKFNFGIPKGLDGTAANNVSTEANNLIEKKSDGLYASISDQLGVASGIATLDSNGKLPVSQMPTSATAIVGYLDAANDHTMPDPKDYEAGNIYVVTSTGYYDQSTAFTLAAGNILTEMEVTQANTLIAAGYTFTLSSGSVGLGTVKTFATNKVTLSDDTEISLPYTSELSATSTPSTVQVSVNTGDLIMDIDHHWIVMSNTSSVTSVNSKTGAVELEAADLGMTSETWTFTLSTGSTATKKVMLLS